MLENSKLCVGVIQLWLKRILHSRRSTLRKEDSQSARSNGADETAELFSDVEGEESGGAGHDDDLEECGVSEEEVRNDTQSPRAFGDSSLKKRPNPFKVSYNYDMICTSLGIPRSLCGRGHCCK